MTEKFTSPHATQQALSETPFVGLVPYGEGDAAFFFGRDDEKGIITANLRASRLTIVYGASGVGKTSVLQAGVVHDLHEQVREIADGRSERAPFAICSFSTWHSDPLPALAESMRAACSEALASEDLTPWQPGEPLLEAVRGWTERVRPLLVVLDQFEEYFLYHAGEDGEGTFACEFPRLVNELNLRVNFVLSLREDAWAKLDRFEDSIPALFENYVRVGHLDREAASEAIDGPVREWNRRLPLGEEPYAVEPALSETVIEAAAAGNRGLTASGDGAAPEAADADGAEAPFLQLVLERLWRETVAAGAHTLGLARLEALGGAQQIVENHLLEALGKLTPTEQSLAADLFRFLVTRSKTKIAHPSTDLAEWTKRPEAEVVAVLEKLCRGEGGRILRSVSPPPGETTTSYELFHDVLAEPILEWRRDYEQESARRLARRRFVRIGAVLLPLVAVFAVLTGWALKKSSDVTNATASARSQELVAAAMAQLSIDPHESVRLADLAIDARATPAAETTLREAIAQDRLRFLETGTSGVSVVSPDGKLLGSGTAHGLQVTDVATGKRLAAITVGSNGAWRSEFDPASRSLATIGNDSRIRVFAARSGTLLVPAFPKVARVAGNTIAWSPDGRSLVTGGDDGTARVWDAGTGRQLLVLHAHGPALRNPASPSETRRIVSTASYDPSGTRILTAGYDGTVRIWDAKSGKPLLRLPRESHFHGWVRVARFSPDGALVLTGGEDHYAYVFDANSGLQLRKFRHPNAVFDAAFSPDSRLVATASEKIVRVWKIASDSVVPLRGHADWVNSVAFRADGALLVSSSADGTSRVWDVDSSTPLFVLHGHRGSVEGAAFALDGRRVITWSTDGTNRIWDIDTGLELRGHTSWVHAAAFARDGRHLLTGSAGGQVWRWEFRMGVRRRAADIGELKHSFIGPVNIVEFSRDGRTFLAAGDDGTAQVRNASTGGKVAVLDANTVLKPPPGAALSASFDTTGRRVAVAYIDGRVEVWNVKSQAPVKELTTGGSGTTGAAFGPRGDVIATSGSDGKIAIWRLRDYTQLYTLTGPSVPARAPSFSRDGRFLVAAWGDGSARVFSLTSGKEVATLPHGAPVVAAAFNVDGRWVGTAGEDGVVRIWDWRQKHLLATLREHSDLINSLTFSPTDPTLVLTAADDHTAKVYRCDTCIPLDRLRKLVADRQAALDAPQRESG